MSEMVEQVASRLIRMFVEKGGTNAHEVARAAIVAMREPTEAMYQAGCDNETCTDPEMAWKAMIDQALSDPVVEAEQRLLLVK